jgi:hypothetical protein
MLAGQTLLLEARSYSAAGDVRTDRFSWRSSSPAILSVDDGLVRALAPGRTTLSVAAGGAQQSVDIEVVANPIQSIEVRPARTHARTGDVIRFDVRARDAQGREVAGFIPTWSFSPGHGVLEADGTFTGYESGEYMVTANLGGRTAVATVRLEPRDVRREVTVLGRLPRTLFTTEEVWVHPNGEVAYLGTGSGGDRMYAIDITDKANPVVTDSLVVNTRRVNDLMTTPDGRYLVFTRENASDRRSGIVIASLEDPRHPSIIAHYTEGVTAGVHSAFVYHQPQYGTHVYATNNGTGSAAYHRHQRSVQSARGGKVEDGRTPRCRTFAARCRCTGRPRLSELLERQPGHPRHRQWHQGRQPVQSAARQPVPIRPQCPLSRR